VDFADAPHAVKRRHHRTELGIIALAAVIASAAHSAEEDVALRPRYQVGDRYALSLAVDTETRVDARGNARNSFREHVELRYAAQIEVLETDGTGLPMRERHESAELTSVRPEGVSELFVRGTVFELVRHADGDVEIQFHGARADPKIEKIVGDVLAYQVEYGMAALLDPGRPAVIGERWELDPARVGAFLRARGIRDVALDGAASAQLAKKGDGLALRYRIPIRAFALPDLPEGASPGSAEGRLSGEVLLDGGGLHRARAHASKLALELEGSVDASRAARAAHWRLQRFQSIDQHSETSKDPLSSSH
jgi:hypothetical protein